MPRSARVLILRTAGTNCDEETGHAWNLAGATHRLIHIRELIERPDRLAEADILTIPGGFSYGDDISAGKIMAVQLSNYLYDGLRGFVERGGLVLGICNGFQVLVKAGLLPGEPTSSAGRQVVTLTQNDSACYEDRWVHLKTGRHATAFFPAGSVVSMPIAHGEGKLVTADRSVLESLGKHGHVAMTYCDAQGQSGAYPINPNGSEQDIAALTDGTGRILGLMPHPERYIHSTQHPAWTSSSPAVPDGRLIFETAVQSVRAA